MTLPEIQELVLEMQYSQNLHNTSAKQPDIGPNIKMVFKTS